ncbi:hypothetical protein BB561_006750 [Smittium simulii]|uniref:Uncharacterized protein n=1 Tax=Smittium simulii TaxID=133385 RepID=A0A2T9Y1Y4_9FUNG|nr:hypothetical protein BB561_006750 [Smittium simulii]
MEKLQNSDSDASKLTHQNKASKTNNISPQITPDSSLKKQKLFAEKSDQIEEPTDVEGIQKKSFPENSPSTLKDPFDADIINKNAEYTPTSPNLDLFGSDSDHSHNQFESNEDSESKKFSADLFGESDEDFDAQNSTSFDDPKVNATKPSSFSKYNDMKDHPKMGLVDKPSIHSNSRHSIVAKFPTGVRLDPHVFEPENWRDLFEKEREIFLQNSKKIGDNPQHLMEEWLKHAQTAIENTARWTYKPAPNSETPKKVPVSNAHFVKWSNGSLTFHVGNAEPFIIEGTILDSNFEPVAKPELQVSGKTTQKNTHQYACVHHTQEGLLQSQDRVAESWVIRPGNISQVKALTTSSRVIGPNSGYFKPKGSDNLQKTGDTNYKDLYILPGLLTSSIIPNQALNPQKSRFNNKTSGTGGTKLYVPDKNPELAAREEEQAEEAKERAYRRLESTRRRQEERVLAGLAPSKRSGQDFRSDDELSDNSRSVYLSGAYPGSSRALDKLPPLRQHDVNDSSTGMGSNNLDKRARPVFQSRNADRYNHNKEDSYEDSDENMYSDQSKDRSKYKKSRRNDINELFSEEELDDSNSLLPKSKSRKHRSNSSDSDISVDNKEKKITNIGGYMNDKTSSHDSRAIIEKNTSDLGSKPSVKKRVLLLSDEDD